MTLLQIISLAILQGFTEFWPISSSGHLILFPHLMRWPDQGLAFDVAVHVGTLMAVFTYFYADLRAMIKDTGRYVLTQRISFNVKLLSYLLLGTVPALIVGGILSAHMQNLRFPGIIIFTTISFALLLGIADLAAPKNKNLQQMNWFYALMIGVAQAFALVPGTSRSGITMTFARFFGFDRESAARFSFLLAIPVILIAGSYEFFQLLHTQNVGHWRDILLGIFISAVTAYFCIAVFLRLVNKLGMSIFVVYRLLLGVFLIWFFWLR